MCVVCGFKSDLIINLVDIWKVRVLKFTRPCLSCTALRWHLQFLTAGLMDAELNSNAVYTPLTIQKDVPKSPIHEVNTRVKSSVYISQRQLHSLWRMSGDLSLVRTWQMIPWLPVGFSCHFGISPDLCRFQCPSPSPQAAESQRL